MLNQKPHQPAVNFGNQAAPFLEIDGDPWVMAEASALYFFKNHGILRPPYSNGPVH
jgi:hypothetical protein